MPLSTAEKNRRKRERKKKEKEMKLKQKDTDVKVEMPPPEEEIQVEYVVESIIPATEQFEELKKFQEKSAILIENEAPEVSKSKVTFQDDDDDELEDMGDEGFTQSKRKQRDVFRPSVAELKRRVARPDLVEAHDVSATDPEFLIQLKAVPGTVPVPRHWGRKRKYLQGKRGFEKRPFQLPDFIVNTGITALRDSVAKDETGMSARQMNRQRVAPKMGAIDVDYRTLYDAFFKHQTKSANMTKFGEVYYEGKELETHTKIKPGRPLSKALRDALGMESDTTPPPWLLNMQRYGPPPSYPALKIPGLNAPLPSEGCQYGYHPGGWGKPPLDAYGRPAYGGNPFDPPGSSTKISDDDLLVTSDGKTLSKKSWGALPMGIPDDESEESGSEMEESSDEESDEEMEVQPEQPVEAEQPVTQGISKAALEIRKQMADESAADEGPKQLYQVIDQKKVDTGKQTDQVFASEVQYVLPGNETKEESNTSAVEKKEKKPSGDDEEDEDDDELEKNFKF